MFYEFDNIMKLLDSLVQHAEKLKSLGEIDQFSLLRNLIGKNNVHSTLGYSDIGTH